MVEKVTAATDGPATTAQGATGTQERPAGTGGATTGGGSRGGTSETGGGGGSPRPASMAGPLENHMAHGEHMADPNGHCLACGYPCPEGARTCPHCGDNPVSWNQKVKDQEGIWRGLGWNDDQIRKAGDDLFGGYKAQGMNAEFQEKLDELEVKKALGE